MIHNKLEKFKNSSLRRAAILKAQKDNSTHLALTNNYLKVKYNLNETINSKTLCKAQIKFLLVNIKAKECHKRLFRVCDHELGNIKDSSVWLTNENIKPRDEGAYYFLQDRNIFFDEIIQCPHCKAAVKTVDHLETKCERMLGHDYTRKHSEVLKCIHLTLCNKYGIKTSKKLKSYTVQEVLANENVKIRVDTRIKTNVKIQDNRPDFFIHDKKKKEIIWIY